MVEIRLTKGGWRFDPAKQLGPSGGFGSVFSGTDAAGNPVAVKRLHIHAADTAHRELTIASDLAGRSFRHVLPVLDAGQDANTDDYFIVMPVAEQSLQDLIAQKGSITELEAAEIIKQITEGLEEAQHIVHRDLKPGNVLWYDGRWQIADFGIARFVEESTSIRTLKDCLSPLYAAPEQWRLEHASPATDIYALGCIGYTLLTGAPPFTGTYEEVREAHLHQTPSDPTATARMRTILSMMLRKSPDARPSRARIKTVFEQILAESPDANLGNPLQHLALAAAAHERAQSEADAENERYRTVVAQRQALVDDARSILRELSEELKMRVMNAVPNAKIRESSESLLIRIGTATLELELQVKSYLADDFPHSSWDVACGSVVEVIQEQPMHRRSASLWFTRLTSQASEFRWYEVGYEGNSIGGYGFPFEPTAVSPEIADRAHWAGMDVVQTAYHPVPIDGEDVDAFCNRWLFILAEACNGGLKQMPHSLPHL